MSSRSKNLLPFDRASTRTGLPVSDCRIDPEGCEEQLAISPIDHPDARAALARVRLLALDVDGVLTDNTIVLDDDGRESKRFFVPDGAGLKDVQRNGVKVALMSGRASGATEARAAELGVDSCRTGLSEKREHLEELLEELGITAGEVCYVGDDTIDLAPMGLSGIAIAVPNAQPSVLAVADFTTRSPGGHGAVREVCDAIVLARKEGSS